ncbi:hypothetical protein OCAE111667_08875 [Occultella aeris]|uniref:Uncharacterized protein n=1 Tax=Occultella aeris TaxID=2761496 RepID=A0A7M4DK01_9MICO|nr:hypothetical protein HALOF300_02463 [Occultella aeris]
MTADQSTPGGDRAASTTPRATSGFWRFLPTLIWLAALGFALGALIGLP